MILAQIKEAADIAQRQLDKAAEFGFEAYVLLFVLMSVVAFILIHFYYIVRPDTEARRISQKSQDECLSTFATNYAVQTQLLNEIDAHLSDIGRQVGLNKVKINQLEGK